jgi:hypothetical protein
MIQGAKARRSEFSKGKAVELQTIFDGGPAPGGSYYPESRHYCKRCKGKNAGRHPHGGGLGGIDDDIFRELIERDCLTIELQLPNEPVRYAAFKDLIQEGVSVRWRDPRFPGPRRYLKENFWHESAFRLRSRLEEISREEHLQAEQEHTKQLNLLDGFLSLANF